MAKNRTPDRGITRADFVGTKMANFLHSMAQNKALPEHERAEARKLQEQWDAVCPVRLNNPITLVELEKAMAAGDLK
jgi:hypothetical protein